MKDLLLKYKEVILYLFFGVCTTLVNIVSYAVLTRSFGVGVMASTACAWALSVAFACLLYTSGNDGTSDKGQVQEVPCDYDSTVGVAAVDAENQRASFSNYGTKKDIAAPGVNIYSTLKTSSYGKKSGTSMAAPIVSAAAGMIYALRPDITTAEVKEILKKTADRIPDEDMQEIGVLNCESALKATGGKVWLPFKDVAVNSWYYDHVAYIYKQEIMTGLTDTIFGPEDGLVRAQFAMILYRLVGEPEALYMWTFPDVGENEWYTDAVADVYKRQS